MNAKPFVICRVSWLTQRPGGDYSFEWVALTFWTITHFLQSNSLVAHELAPSIATIQEEFEIRSDDLTAEGLQFMRTGYQKWLRMLDRGGDPSDVRILSKELAKMRNSRDGEQA